MDEIDPMIGYRSTVPEELVRDIAENNTVLFLGNVPGRQRSSDLPAPTEADVADRLCALCNYSGPHRSFAEIAQRFEQDRDRNSLVQVIADLIDQPQIVPSPVHQQVARLPFPIYLTTDLHLHLEQALAQVGRRFIKVVTGTETSFGSPDCPIVVKLFGDISDESKLYITARDRMHRFQEHRLLVETIRGWLATHRVLLLVPDFEDNALRQLLGPVFDAQGNLNRLAYAVHPGPLPLGGAFWSDREVKIVEAEPSVFLEALSRQLRSYQKDEKRYVPAAVRRPTRPFKFLYYYDETDTEIFFGRDSEITTVTSQVRATHLFVLTGESGAGKTSLLLAGILPRLRSMGLMTVPIRFSDDPLTNIKRKLSDLGRGWQESHTLIDDEATTLRATSSLADWIRALQAHTQAPLVLVLDQFEKFFTRFSIQAQQRFISELTEVLTSHDVGVHLVLALREDLFARLHLFRSQIPTIFDHTLHLHRLEAPQAEKAIVGPLDTFGVHFEPDLVQAILTDLSQEGEIQPPQLQIVCDRIYQHLLDEGEKVANLALYERLGGAGQILAQYLENVLESLPESQQETSRAILKSLVTSERMKDLLTASEVADLVDFDLRLVEESIVHLVNLRLLRPVRDDVQAPGGIVRYELAHDRLALRISEWIIEPERQARKAKEILRRELISWRDHKLLLRLEELQVIAQQRVNRYLKLDAAEGEFLLNSALRHDSEIRKWIERLEDQVDVAAVLDEGLRDKKPEVRERAALWLGQLEDAGAADALLDSALKDGAISVRRQAAESLIRVDEFARDKLVDKLSNSETRIYAASVLWDHRRMLALQPHVWIRARMITTWERLKVLVQAMPAFTRRNWFPVTVILILILVMLWYFGPMIWTPKPNLTWVTVPAGSFAMGSQDGADNARPEHLVSLPSFQLSMYETTNADYQQCVRARRCERPESARYVDPSYARHPVVGVNWHNAHTFCQWVGGRLPTEAEWEKAATWNQGTSEKYTWPWGNTWHSEYLNSLESSLRATVEVGQYPAGASPYGIMDIAGNAWEWTNSLFEPYPYDAADGRESPDKEEARVVRGGSWANVDAVARPTNRASFDPSTRSEDLGFRCARTE